jgi:hypothetical protein
VYQTFSEDDYRSFLKEYSACQEGFCLIGLWAVRD